MGSDIPACDLVSLHSMNKPSYGDSRLANIPQKLQGHQITRLFPLMTPISCSV